MMSYSIIPLTKVSISKLNKKVHSKLKQEKTIQKTLPHCVIVWSIFHDSSYFHNKLLKAKQI